MLTREQVRRLRAGELKGTNRLGLAMELAGVTQVQLAEQVGMTQPYISAVLNGKAPKFPLPTAHRLAAFFGCAIEDLFPAPDRESEVA
jgi:transcriptional regulator with XRE-family HTH domain